MLAINGMKVCSKCKVNQPIENYHKDKRYKDGLYVICKQCRIEYRINNKEQLAARYKQYYEANKEKVINRVKNYTEKNKDVVLQRHKEYREKNKEVVALKDKQKYEKNRERCLLQFKENYQKNREARLQRAREVRWSNLNKFKEKDKKYYLENKERLNIKASVYYQFNKDKYAIYSHNRRAHEQNAAATLTSQQWNKIIQHQNNKCLMCGKQFTKERPPTKDHIVPVSKGGGLTFENVQALCKSCNSTKKNKLDPTKLNTWLYPIKK